MNQFHKMKDKNNYTKSDHSAIILLAVTVRSIRRVYLEPIADLRHATMVIDLSFNQLAHSFHRKQHSCLLQWPRFFPTAAHLVRFSIFLKNVSKTSLFSPSLSSTALIIIRISRIRFSSCSSYTFGS